MGATFRGPHGKKRGRQDAALTAETFTAPGTPHGCMVVLGALSGDETPDGIRAHLRTLRTSRIDLLHELMTRAVADGELLESTDLGALATFYTTIQQGMSIQARDGASRNVLNRVADAAMAAWDELIGMPATAPKATAGQRRRAVR